MIAGMTSSSQPSPTVPTGTAGVFVVIPAFNEGPAIAEVLAQLKPFTIQLIVVDDGSTDSTFETARQHGAHALRHAINRGQGAALQTGIAFALRRGAEIIVTFDADGQHQVSDLPALIAPIQTGRCEIVLGSRFLSDQSQMPRRRRLLLRLATWFTRVVSRMPVTDAHNGLRAFSRRAAERIDIHLDRMAHASELIDQVRTSGLPWCEVPVSVRYTAYSLAKGQSSRGALKILAHYLLGKVMP